MALTAESGWASPMNERWLLTGGTGQVGTALLRRPPSGVELIAPPRAELDLSDQKSIEAIRFDGFDAVVNCGAYTAVDRAESEPDLAHAINCEAAAALAAGAAAAGIPIVHVSTDYVFGEGTGPWQEDAPLAPQGVYGRTKAEAEAAIAASGVRHAIVRTAWVVSADGANFVKTMLRLGAERDTLRVVSDQRGTPTHAGDLAEALGTIAKRFTGDAAMRSGIWHCANSGETTWHGLAEQVFVAARQHGMRTPAQVEAIATSDYPTPARRPRDSRLDCRKLQNDFGISLRPWQEAVDEIVARIAGQARTE